MKLVEACKVGDLEAIQNAVGVDGIDPTVEDNLPLRIAARHGHLQVVKFLLHQGANPAEGEKVADEYKMGMSITPDVAEPAIVQSAAFGFERIVDLLLQDMRAVEMVCLSKSLALEYAAANAHEEVVVKLSQYYFTRKAENGNWRSVWFASVSSKELKIVEIISECIAASSQPYERYYRDYALAFAVKGGDLGVVSFILENDLYDDCEYALRNCLEELENEIDDGTRAAMLGSLLRLGRGNEIKLKEIIRRCIGQDRFYEVNRGNKLIRTFFESEKVHEYMLMDDPDKGITGLWHIVCNNSEDLFFLSR